MINRTKINNSIYNILDEDPKAITQYQEKEAKKTQKQKDKEKENRNKKSNITLNYSIYISNNIETLIK